MAQLRRKGLWLIRGLLFRDQVGATTPATFLFWLSLLIFSHNFLSSILTLSFFFHLPSTSSRYCHQFSFFQFYVVSTLYQVDHLYIDTIEYS